jgi:hypothetical protein
VPLKATRFRRISSGQSSVVERRCLRATVQFETVGAGAYVTLAGTPPNPVLERTEEG